jgi:hypothetical protein
LVKLKFLLQNCFKLSSNNTNTSSNSNAEILHGKSKSKFSIRSIKTKFVYSQFYGFNTLMTSVIMRQKDIRPAPARIEFKGMKFLITDRPSDVTIATYIMVSICCFSMLSMKLFSLRFWRAALLNGEA